MADETIRPVKKIKTPPDAPPIIKMIKTIKTPPDIGVSMQHIPSVQKVSQEDILDREITGVQEQVMHLKDKY
jgi:hypothetical protein